MYEHDFCEYAVEKKKSGAYLVKTVSVILALVLLLIVAFSFFDMTIRLIAISAVAVFAWYLSRYLSIEYEYTQTGSTLDFAAVYSKQYRKEKLSIDIKKCASKIAPANGMPELKSVAKVYDFRSSSDSENAYAILFDESGVKCAVLFDATKRMVTNLRYAYPSIVTVSDTLTEE